ncbi:hypothetical protein GX865_02625 [Candidatus Saccharibacteria bacterium]|jgi:hypothetical protein|nr:hypothetical protein [Candidatus Saccharibacteria bacterium]
MQEEYVTKDMLETFGVKIDETKVASLLEHINSTVEERIGAEITESLSDDQLKELLELQDNSTDEEVGEWISKQVPNYAEIVDDNIAITIGEVVESVEGINQA